MLLSTTGACSAMHQEAGTLRAMTFFPHSSTNYLKLSLHLFPAQQLLFVMLKEHDLGFFLHGCVV